MPTRPDSTDPPRQSYRYAPTVCPENVADQALRDWLRREFDAVRRSLVDRYTVDVILARLTGIETRLDSLENP